MGGARRGDHPQDFALSHVTHQAQEHTESTAVAMRESESGNFSLLQLAQWKNFNFVRYLPVLNTLAVAFSDRTGRIAAVVKWRLLEIRNPDHSLCFNSLQTS